MAPNDVSHSNLNFGKLRELTHNQISLAASSSRSRTASMKVILFSFRRRQTILVGSSLQQTATSSSAAANSNNNRQQVAAFSSKIDIEKRCWDRQWDGDWSEKEWTILAAIVALSLLWLISQQLNNRKLELQVEPTYSFQQPTTSHWPTTSLRKLPRQNRTEQNRTEQNRREQKYPLDTSD